MPLTFVLVMGGLTQHEIAPWISFAAGRRIRQGLQIVCHYTILQNLNSKFNDITPEQGSLKSHYNSKGHLGCQNFRTRELMAKGYCKFSWPIYI